MTVVDIKLLPISSPTSQALMQEQVAIQKETKLVDLIAKCKEILVIHLDEKLIAYATFDLLDGQNIRINSLHFRDLFQHHLLAQYWLSRHVKRKVADKRYLNFLIAS